MTRTVLTLLALCLFGFVPTAHADDATFNYKAFAHIPILHEGRVKPLDTFARAYLRQLHGSQKVDGQTATAWLAESLFRPDVAVRKPFIHIPKERIARALELPTQKGTLHTYQDVANAYEKKREMIIALIKKGEENLSLYERDFIDFYSLINDYSQVTRALTLVLPSQQQVSEAYAKKLGFDGTERTYLELIKAKDQVIADTKSAVKKHGNKIEKYSGQQREAAQLAFYFVNVEATGEQNRLFRVIPAFLGNGSEWYAPWALLNDGHGSPEGSKLLEHWGALAVAYHQEDSMAFTTLSKQIRNVAIDTQTVSDMQIDLEVLYYKLNPTLWIMICYGLVFVLLIVLSLRAQRSNPDPIVAKESRLPRPPQQVRGPRNDTVVKYASHILMIGITLHLAMIALRIFILDRPPVGTLYESVLFVALIAVLFAWRLDGRTGSHEGKLIGSLLGAFLVGISGLFAPVGDTLGVLVAVLNTNFWLATHVVCITIGYGLALVAGTMAHVYLLKHSRHLERATRVERPQANREDPSATLRMTKTLQTATLIALLFTAIGTILGGIWADQSWGRFWGWDPKENGALAIVIWLIWLLHGRITGHLKEIGFAACLAVTNIIVALSWFGVNLLSVGLHSYGFTDSAAYGLAAFCLGELAIIAALTIYAKRGQRHAS